MSVQLQHAAGGVVGERLGMRLGFALLLSTLMLLAWSAPAAAARLAEFLPRVTTSEIFPRLEARHVQESTWYLSLMWRNHQPPCMR